MNFLKTTTYENDKQYIYIYTKKIFLYDKQKDFDIFKLQNKIYKKCKNKMIYDNIDIFLVSLCICIKFLIDIPPINKDWCNVFGYELKYFNKVEIEILNKINYNIFYKNYNCCNII